MLNLLYNLFVMPIQILVEMIFFLMNKFFDNPGLAIIGVSIVIQTFLLPLYKRAELLQEEEREKQKQMSHWVTHIKKTFRGDERFMMLQAYYKEQNYKSVYTLKSSISILLQIPFFIAAYRYLSYLQELQGTGFFWIKDLGRPDQMLQLGGVGINVLPIIMTLINICSGVIYTKNLSTKDKIQVYGLAVLFLLLLYNSPAGLVLYWTMNNVYSLAKNVFMKLLKHPKEILAGVVSVLAVCILVFQIKSRLFSPLRTTCILGIAVFCWLPMIKQVISKYLPQISKERSVSFLDNMEEDPQLFALNVFFFAILMGAFIPLNVISASAVEFINENGNPLELFFHSFFVFLGLFVIWFTIFFMLMPLNLKKLFSIFLFGVAGASLINYMVYNNHLGTMSPVLTYDKAPRFSEMQQAVNLIVFVLTIFFLGFLCFRKGKICKSLLGIVILSMIVICGIHIGTIYKDVKIYQKNAENNAADNIFKFSKEGKNIAVIMLDRAISGYIPYIFEEKPELQKEFDGFVYYPNTLTYNGHTKIAAPPLFGGYEYTPAELNKRNSESLVNKHDESLKVMPKIFSDAGYQVTVCDPPLAGYSWTPNLTIYDGMDHVKAYITTESFDYKAADFDLVFDKAVQKKNFIYYSVIKTVPLFLHDRLYNDGKYCSEKTAMDVDYEVHPQFYKDFTALMSLEDMTEIDAGNSNNFLMLQNGTTHNAMVLKSPEYLPVRADSQKEVAAQQNRVKNGHLMLIDGKLTLKHYQVNVAALQEIGKWIKFLKKEGVYDNTRIIIVSDHGFDLGQFDYMLLDNGVDVEFYNALLMMKDFNAHGYDINNDFMTTADVPTLSLEGVVSNPINPYTGKKISNDEKKSRAQCITTSGNWYTEDRDETYLDTSDGIWYEVSDNIFESENWKEIKEP